MAVPRHKAAGVTLADGRVLVVGGSDHGDFSGRYRSAELFDPSTGQFERTGDMAGSRYKISGAVVLLADGRVLVAGGARQAELYDPSAGAFTAVPADANLGYSFATATRLADGTVVVAGGYDDRISLTDQVLRFLP
jgi:hypothetical protein